MATTQENGLQQIIVGLIAGFVVAGFLAAGLAGVIGYVVVKRVERNARRGWNLVPVVVASQDVPAGTPFTFDMLGEASIPEQFVTASVMKPSEAPYALHEGLWVPVLTGQPLRWSYFQSTKVQPKGPYSISELLSACTRAWRVQPEAMMTPQTVEDLRARMTGGSR